MSGGGGWPDAGDYQDAFLHPARTLGDPTLAACAVPDRTPFGLPQPVAGANAHVYRLVSESGGSVAARVFLKPSPGRSARYPLLAARLEALENAPPWLVAFRWQDRGIWAGGAWRPLMAMAWILGADLGGAIESRLGTPGRMRDLADSWRALSLSLAASGVVHGDLQRGNVLVEPAGALRLIDYDAAWTPSMDALPPEMRAAETGHPAFQHPRRPAGSLGVGGDRFPALLIYVALRALAVAPETWYRLDNGDNLLFRPEDLLQPGTARAFEVLRTALRAHPPELALLEALALACRQPLALIPPLTRFV